MLLIIMKNNEVELKPILKWVGGKRQILDKIIPLIPPSFNSYFEPFAGGLALCLALKPHKAYINDLNADLITFYSSVKNYPDKLILLIKRLKNDKETFYKIRSLDRNPNYQYIDDVFKSARFYYLNKTVYNGLHRVNSKGEFNAPFGNYRNFNIDEENLLKVSDYLNNNYVKLLNLDFEEVTIKANPDDFIYFDPPYQNTFNQYNSYKFNDNEQIRLKEVCDYLTKRNIRFLLSNSNSEFIRKLYKDYKIIEIETKRSINSKGNHRTGFKEFLIRNY